MTSAPRPWSTADLAAVGANLVLGGTLWAGGWWASSGSADAGGTIDGVVFAVVAVGVVASGGLSWIGKGRRAVRRRHRELMDLVEPRTAVLKPVAAGAATDVVALAGSSRFHRADCLLVRGKDVLVLSSSADQRRRHIPCEMCQP